MGDERTIDVYLDAQGQVVQNPEEAVRMRRTVIDATTGTLLRTEHYERPRDE